MTTKTMKDELKEMTNGNAVFAEISKKMFVEESAEKFDTLCENAINCFDVYDAHVDFAVNTGRFFRATREMMLIGITKHDFSISELDKFCEEVVERNSECALKKGDSIMKHYYKNSKISINFFHAKDSKNIETYVVAFYLNDEQHPMRVFTFKEKSGRQVFENIMKLAETTDARILYAQIAIANRYVPNTGKVGF